MLAAVAFLDAFQKVADMATNTRGGERHGRPGMLGVGNGQAEGGSDKGEEPRPRVETLGSPPGWTGLVVETVSPPSQEACRHEW